jgi:hypothetical protein
MLPLMKLIIQPIIFTGTADLELLMSEKKNDKVGYRVVPENKE